MSSPAVTVALESASLEDLRTALARWLEHYGHSVHHQVPCPDGGTVDLLTPMYAIVYLPSLSPAALWAAVDDLQSRKLHFPDQRLVIAGLTPETEWESAYDIAEQLKTKDIEVWFLDQNTSFVEHYNQLTADPLPPTQGQGLRRNPLTGCFISLGMAVILSASFWVAYRILDRHQLQVASNSQDNRSWDQLHSAVEVWDMDTALSSLDRLGKSRNPCVSEFADRFTTSLTQQGAEGFRDINPIKRALNMQEGCRLEIREYDFSQ